MGVHNPESRSTPARAASTWVRQSLWKVDVQRVEIGVTPDYGGQYCIIGSDASEPVAHNIGRERLGEVGDALHPVVVDLHPVDRRVGTFENILKEHGPAIVGPPDVEQGDAPGELALLVSMKIVEYN